MEYLAHLDGGILRVASLSLMGSVCESGIHITVHDDRFGRPQVDAP